MGIPLSLSWNFIKGLHFFFFSSKAAAKPGLCLAPGNMQRHAPGRLVSGLTALIFCTVSRDRNQIPRASGREWNKLLGEECGQLQKLSPGGSAGGQEPPLPGSLLFWGLWLIIKGQRLEALFISTTLKKRKKTYVK